MAFLEIKNVSKALMSTAAAPRSFGTSIYPSRRESSSPSLAIPARARPLSSTLIAGLIRPDAGSLVLNDLEITGPGPDRGVVFQNYSLLPWLNVHENILLAVDQVFPTGRRPKRNSMSISTSPWSTSA